VASGVFFIREVFMKVSVLLVCLASAGVGVQAAHAALTGSATATPTNLGGGQWGYSIQAQNSGDTTIGTLWFAWVPGKNFMGSAPSNITAPADWNILVTHGGATDGWGIRWTAANAAARIAPGASLAGFGFETAQAPTALLANSPFYPDTPTTTSFFYIGNAFGDPGLQFVVNVVPTPAGAAVLMGGAVVLGRRRRS
jgi:hypothetical protein